MRIVQYVFRGAMMRSVTPKLVDTIAIAVGLAALAGGVATRLSAETVVGQTRMVDISR